jgi:membrane-bound inhibitor of C-type lysozyme
MSTAASAQTFQTFRCADGTHFIAAFYPHDARAYLQIDGAPVTLRERLSWSGARYSGGRDHDNQERRRHRETRPAAGHGL